MLPIKVCLNYTYVIKTFYNLSFKENNMMSMSKCKEFRASIYYFIYLLSYLSITLGSLLRLLRKFFYFKTLGLFYDLFSRFYDNFTLSLPNYSTICQFIVQLAHPSKNDCALDVACGTGLVTLLLTQRAGEVVGLDLSLGQLKQLQLKARGIANIHLVLGDARKLPFRGGSFDLITCSGALSEIIDKKYVIKEMYNVLSYDGRIAIMTFNKENIPLLRSWAYNAEELEKDLRDCRLKEIRLLKIKPFYIIAKAKKGNLF